MSRWSAVEPESVEDAAGYVLVRIRVWPEGDEFVGECVELGVSSFGATVDDAIRMTLEAVEVHLEGLDEIGERERVFAERGLTFYSSEPTAEVYTSMHPGEVVSSQRLALASH